MKKRKLNSEFGEDFFMQPSILCRIPEHSGDKKVTSSCKIIRKCYPENRFSVPITYISDKILSLTHDAKTNDYDRSLNDFITKYTAEFNPHEHEEDSTIIVLNACWLDPDSHSSLPCHCMDDYYNCNECVPGYWIQYLTYSLRRNYPQHAFVSTCPSCKLGPQCFKNDESSYDDMLLKQKEKKLEEDNKTGS